MELYEHQGSSGNRDTPDVRGSTKGCAEPRLRLISSSFSARTALLKLCQYFTAIVSDLSDWVQGVQFSARYRINCKGVKTLVKTGSDHHYLSTSKVIFLRRIHEKNRIGFLKLQTRFPRWRSGWHESTENCERSEISMENFGKSTEAVAFLKKEMKHSHQGQGMQSALTHTKRR